MLSCEFANVEVILDVILGRYAHTPGLRLTLEQACRVWALGDARCQGVLDALVDTGFLTWGIDGTYGR